MSRSNNSAANRLALAFAVLLFAACSSRVEPEPLNANDIVAKAFEAAGGDAWRQATSIRLTGHASLHRNGNPAGLEVDDYEMLRIYPVSLDKANTGTGKFRLDARRQGRLIFQTSFDGEHLYDRNGRVAEDEATSREAAAFGYSAIRFALSDGFNVERLVDDQIEGFPSYFIRVTDPSGGKTLFAIDQSDYSIRLVAWDTPQGWHHRIYSDFYWVDDPGFRQPGRVRFYYDGVKSVDIRWTKAEVNVAIPDEKFRLGDDAPQP